MAGRFARVALGATALVALATRPAVSQQTERPLTFGVATGLARTSGGTGYHASATLDYRLPVKMLGLRAEGTYASWGGVGVVEFRSIVASATLNPLPRARVSPYAIVGGGGYAFGDGMQPGWSLGFGLLLPHTTQLRLESRVHSFRWDGTDLPLGHPAFRESKERKYVWMPFSLGVRF